MSRRLLRGGLEEEDKWKKLRAEGLVLAAMELRNGAIYRAFEAERQANVFFSVPGTLLAVHRRCKDSLVVNG